MLMLVIAVHAALAATEGCSILEGGVVPLRSPPDGSVDVPTNARIVLFDGSEHIGPGVVAVRTEAGPIAVDEEVVAVDHGGRSEQGLLVLTPRQRLTPGTTVTVHTGDVLHGSFLVGNRVDTTPPVPPRATVIDGVDFDWCGPKFEIDVVNPVDATFATASIGEDDIFAAVSVEGSMIVFGESSQTYAVAIRAVDMAGNVSDPVTVVGTMPAAFGEIGPGCFCGSGANPWPVAVLALALGLRRRRRRFQRGVS